jgi:hypothetical protein
LVETVTSGGVVTMRSPSASSRAPISPNRILRRQLLAARDRQRRRHRDDGSAVPAPAETGQRYLFVESVKPLWKWLS